MFDRLRFSRLAQASIFFTSAGGMATPSFILKSLLGPGFISFPYCAMVAPQFNTLKDKTK